MKVTLTWLKQYVDFDWPPGELAERLTMLGLEVEDVRTIAGEFDGIVVAQILSRDKVPGSEKLSVCKVNDGRGERARISLGFRDSSPLLGVRVERDRNRAQDSDDGHDDQQLDEREARFSPSHWSPLPSPPKPGGRRTAIVQRRCHDADARQINDFRVHGAMRSPFVEVESCQRLTEMVSRRQLESGGSPPG